MSDNNKCKNCQTKLIGKFCSEFGDYIGSKQKGRFKIQQLKMKKTEKNVIFDTSSGSIYVIDKDSELCKKIHCIE